MERQERAPAAIVVGPDPAQIREWGIADGFASPIRLVEGLCDVAARLEGLVVAALDRSRIVGFIAINPPLPGDRLYTVTPMAELSAVEVAFPYRGRGVFQRMFEAIPDLEEKILYVKADPVLRDRGESVRAFRDRITGVLGSVGFFPMPTDDRPSDGGRDTVFLVRMGSRVTRADATSLVDGLRGSTRRARVAVYMRDPMLRELVRTHLERHGYDIVAIGSRPGTEEGADAVVTEFSDLSAAPVTIRITQDDRSTITSDALWLPSTHLDLLPKVLEAELGKVAAHG